MLTATIKVVIALYVPTLAAPESTHLCRLATSKVVTITLFLVKITRNNLSNK